MFLTIFLCAGICRLYDNNSVSAFLSFLYLFTKTFSLELLAMYSSILYGFITIAFLPGACDLYFVQLRYVLKCIDTIIVYNL